MDILSFLKSRAPNPRPLTADDVNPLIGSAYVSEYMMAIDRTEAFGFEAPPRLLVKKDCVELGTVRPVLLDYFDENSPASLIGQTAAIHFALVPLLYDKTGIPFQLTIGWMMRQGKPVFQHDERSFNTSSRGNPRRGCATGVRFICGSPRRPARFSMSLSP
jgi:hypothetical protein